MAMKRGFDWIVMNIVAHVVVTLFALACLLPFIMLVASSFSSEESILRDGFTLFPRVFSLEAYKFVMKFPERILSAYSVTFLITIVGTLLAIWCCSMAGYVLQRKDFRYRNTFSFVIYFTTLFSVGMIPQYILVTRFLRLTDTMAALILPPLLSPFLIILMRTFIRQAIPDAIVDAAKIDGANDFTIYWRIVMPLSKAALATIGLFIALRYWNDWFHGMLYIRTPEKFPLQYYLYNILMNAQMLREMAQVQISGAANMEIPQESVKMATAVITTGPILFLYPFVQRYFVSGLTIGAVKG